MKGVEISIKKIVETVINNFYFYHFVSINLKKQNQLLNMVFYLSLWCGECVIQLKCNFENRVGERNPSLDQKSTPTQPTQSIIAGTVFHHHNFYFEGGRLSNVCVSVCTNIWFSGVFPRLRHWLVSSWFTSVGSRWVSLEIYQLMMWFMSHLLGFAFIHFES